MEMFAKQALKGAVLSETAAEQRLPLACPSRCNSLCKENTFRCTFLGVQHRVPGWAGLNLQVLLKVV